MAEADLIDLTGVSGQEEAAAPRFFCHSCNSDIENVTPEYTCPQCSNGFVEELPPPAADSSSDVDMMETESYTDFNNRLTDELSSLFMSVTGARPPPDAEEESDQNNSSGRRRRRRMTMMHQAPSFSNFDNILHELLISVTGGQPGAAGGTPMFFMGNPGDYAWGREGLDSIVTQLLNQMDSTGPPPLGADKIAEIPKVEVTKDQVDSKLQCSVCWEDFQLNETVRKLTCLHVYHEACIVPWLELHGTCPICRKSFVPDTPEDQQQRANNLTAAAANSIRRHVLMIPDNNEATTSSSVNPSSSHQHQLNPNAFSSLLINFNQPQRQQQQQQQQQDQQNPSGRNGGTGGGSNNRDRDDFIDYDFD